MYNIFSHNNNNYKQPQTTAACFLPASISFMITVIFLHQI